ncbi:MAG TPA: hypothetical protein H9755_02965 [Candidatus Dietzia intestinigallinarum]|nr:hypothetical protein [Candidatus Dietzia intestinigallinarum]
MKSFGRVVVAASAAVAFTAGSAVVAPVVGAAPGSADLLGSLGTGSLGGDSCGEHVVTSVNEEGSAWSTPTDETPAVIDEAPTGAPDGVGDYALTFPTDTENGTSLYKNANRKKLSELVGEDGDLRMNFDYSTDGQAPALQIRLNDASLADSEEDEAGYEDGFATIVWSPKPAEGWAEANPDESNQFWVTRDLKGADGGEPVERGKRMTLKEIVALNPVAVVTEYGVQKTRDNTAENVAIDNFTFGCETTNFELPAEDDLLGSVTGSLDGDTGSLAVGGLLAVGAGVAAAVFAAQNGLIQIPGL